MTEKSVNGFKFCGRSHLKIFCLQNSSKNIQSKCTHCRKKCFLGDSMHPLILHQHFTRCKELHACPDLCKAVFLSPGLFCNTADGSCSDWVTTASTLLGPSATVRVLKTVVPGGTGLEKRSEWTGPWPWHTRCPMGRGTDGTDYLAPSLPAEVAIYFKFAFLSPFS